MMKINKALLMFNFILFFFSFLYSDVLVEINKLNPEQLRVEGFRLNQKQEVEVEVKGLFQKNRLGERLLGYGWIMNSETREVVWVMESEERFTSRPRVFSQKEKIELSPATYEVYYTTYPYFRREGRRGIRELDNLGDYLSQFFSRLFDRNFENNNYRRYRDLYQQFQIIVKGEGEKISNDELKHTQNLLRGMSFITLDANQDDFYKYLSFELLQEAEVEIYALGEARDDVTYDFGWIEETQTHKKVWEMDRKNTNHAGGSPKNIVSNDIVKLPAGQYNAVYVTDDSHSPREWNSTPPFDPVYWGLNIRCIQPEDNAFVKNLDFPRFDPEKKIVDLTRVRDDALDVIGFTLNRLQKIEIYSVGEGSPRKMFDYGWIVDTKTHQKVWEMQYNDTQHAGGGRKNRLVDTRIELDAGNYLAYYITDDSHSFRDWNVSPPYDPDSWGLSIYACGEDFSPTDFSTFLEEEDPSVLARIVRVRDDQYKYVNFSLKEHSDILIYAIGEGRRGKMFDFAWIEQAGSGKIVWEMTYEKSRGAGGANKNRLVEETVTLEAGEYKLYYESDDSHSFNNWNTAPPSDPLNYGVTLYRQNNEMDL